MMFKKESELSDKSETFALQYLILLLNFWLLHDFRLYILKICQKLLAFFGKKVSKSCKNTEMFNIYPEKSGKNSVK